MPEEAHNASLTCVSALYLFVVPRFTPDDVALASCHCLPQSRHWCGGRANTTGARSAVSCFPTRRFPEVSATGVGTPRRKRRSLVSVAGTPTAKHRDCDVQRRGGPFARECSLVFSYVALRVVGASTLEMARAKVLLELAVMLRTKYGCFCDSRCK